MSHDSEIKILFLEIRFTDELETDLPRLGFPAGNLVATKILLNYLDFYFKAEGLNDCKIFGGGEFNRAIGIIKTRDIGATTAILQAALSSAGILAHAHAYYFDEAELVLRRLIPAGGAPVSVSNMPAEFFERFKDACILMDNVREFGETILAARLKKYHG